jgi:hypothetical protein
LIVPPPPKQLSLRQSPTPQSLPTPFQRSSSICATWVLCSASAPLILGEDENAYDSLLAKVTNAFKPHDIIEELYVDDFVDAAWPSASGAIRTAGT